MKKEVIAEYTYELPLPNDDEIIKHFNENGISNVNPESVRNYIRKSIYKLYCEITTL